MSILELETKRDLHGLWSKAEVWSFLARLDIRKRYTRSKLGPFWLVLINGIYIFSLAFVFTILFDIRSAELLPWIALGVTIWGLISQFLIEATTLFSSHAQTISQERVSFSVIVMTCLAKNVLVSAHNMVIYPLIVLYYSVPFNGNILWLIGTLPLFCLILFVTGFIIAVVSTRFRDVPPFVQGLVTMGFFLTPVMWLPSQVATHPYIYNYNPAAQLLEILRSPLLGEAPSTWALGLNLVVLAVLSGVLLFLLNRYRNRIVYWL